MEGCGGFLGSDQLDSKWRFTRATLTDVSEVDDEPRHQRKILVLENSCNVSSDQNLHANQRTSRWRSVT